MQLATTTPARPTRRAGMTLIELLVVMTIIAILASLSIGGVFKLRESQMKNFTETTVQKLASALDGQWKAALDTINDEQVPLWATQMARGEPRRAKVIYIKARLKQEFPVTFDTARTPVAGQPLGIKPAYKKLGALTSSSATQDWESSALLYLALSQGRRGMAAFNPDEIDPAAIAQRVVNDPVTKQPINFTIFVDAWGQPLRYYAFPYDNDELNGPPYVNSTSSTKDPQDPEGTLTGFSPAAFSVIHPLGKGLRHLIPVVASAGRDGKWGIGPLWMDSDILNQDQANDNIYSYRMRQFGARGD